MDMVSTIKDLEMEWDLEYGFLGGVRQGDFRPERLERLINLLRNLGSIDSTSINKRFVSLTWYIPIFLIWQKERYIELGRDTTELDQGINRIVDILESILGIP